MSAAQGELSDAEVSSLGEEGYFVRPQFLGERAAALMHGALLSFLKSRELSPAAVSRGVRRHSDSALRGDLTTWVTPDEAPSLAPLWTAFQQLGDALSAQAFLGLGKFELQLALYPGGGAHYVRHRDAFEGSENRRLTAIWYANPAWRPEHGGALRLHVKEGAVDVEPALDRLVVFLSERIEHEVLPAHAPRLALTAWYSALR